MWKYMQNKAQPAKFWVIWFQETLWTKPMNLSGSRITENVYENVISSEPLHLET